MATHDYSLANQSGASFRTDLNNALAAIQSNNSNSSSPTTTVAYQWWADTTANIFKIRNSANNAWINLFTLAGGIDVDAASNFNEDVTFTGASANIVFDKSDNALEFADNAKATFGTGGDLEIFHDASFSRIKDTGANALIFQSGEHRIQNEAANETMAKFIGNGAVELYFDNSKKFFTITNGVQANNRIIVGENNAQRGILSGDANGVSVGTIGDLTFNLIRNSQIKARIDGNDFQIPNDTGKIELGASQDLQIYHDGSNSHISDEGTGSLLIKGDVVNLGTTGGEYYFRGFEDGACFLRFDNSNKFFTHSAGVTVESTGNTPTIVFRGASGLDMGNIAVDQFVSNNSLMTFSTLSSGTQSEVCRLLDNGQILIGKTSNATATGAGFVISANSNVACSSTGSADHDFLEFFRGTNGSMTRVGKIRTNGSSTTYSTSSDYRLKENVAAISDGITRLKTLKPYRFNFKTDTSTVVDGFFAHEVTAVPEAVTGTKDEVDSDNNPVYQGIDQSKLVPLLVAAVQELITKVETLEAA